MNSSSRGGVAVRNLVVHTTEGIMRARDLRAYFDRIGTASCHAAADETGVLLEGSEGGFVDYDRAAWTIRNGNPWTDNLELCARASWTRAEWLARPLLLERCAEWLARRHKARGIPLDKLTVPELRQQRRGVIDHDDYTDATGDGTHWDVGENFPWDVIIPRAIALAGPVRPAPTPTRRRRRRHMYLTRNQDGGAIYLATERGLTHLKTHEEVNVCAWLLDDTREASAVLNHNRRFHDVLRAVLGREPVGQLVSLSFGAPAAAPDLRPPVEVDDPDAIAPPPGFAPFLADAPGHDVGGVGDGDGDA